MQELENKEEKKFLGWVTGTFLVVAAVLFFLKQQIQTTSESKVSAVSVGSVEVSGAYVQIQENLESVPRYLKSTEALHVGEVITVGLSSRAQLHLSEYGGSFLLEPNTRVQIMRDREGAGDDFRLRLRLIYGGLSFLRGVSGADAIPRLVLEMADDTLVGLNDLDKMNIFKQRSGLYQVIDTAQPVYAYIYSQNENKDLHVEKKWLNPREIFLPDTRVAEQPTVSREFSADMIAHLVPLEKTVAVAALKKHRVPRRVASDSKTQPVAVQSLATAIPSPPPGLRPVRWEVSPYYTMSFLNARDAITGIPAKLSSEYNIGLYLRFINQWSESFQSYFSLKLGMVAFERPKDSTKSLQNNNNFVPGLGFGTIHHWGNRFRLGLNLDYQKELFVRGVTSQIVTVDSVALPSLGLRLSYDLLQQNSYALGVAAIASAKGGASTEKYNIQPGSEYGMTVYARPLDLLGLQPGFEADLSLLQRQQNTSITSQSETSVIFGLRYLH